MDTYLQFRRPGRSCLLCDKDLSPLDRHRSALKIDSAAAQAVREDMCPECWERLGEKAYFSFWITKRFQEGPSPEQRRLAKAERNEALWALFNALHAIRDEEVAPQLFLLAHLLMKYRVLQFTGRDAERATLRFLHAPTQESFEVDDLPLDSVSFVEVMQEVEGKLHQYAPEPAAAAEEGGGGD